MIGSALSTLHYITNHPLNRSRRGSALARWFRWQIGSRLVQGSHCVPFVNDTLLMVESGMTGATQNIYCGLADYREMAFVLHLLRETDLFVDIGANVGTYTLLATSAVGCRSISIEPIIATSEALWRNVRLNECEDRVSLHRVAVGDKDGMISMTSSFDTMNHVTDGEEDKVPIKRLDDLCRDVPATLLKIDIEGYELPCLRGARAILAKDTLKAVIIELNGSGERYGHTDQQVHTFVTGFGFEAYLYHPFERVLTPLTDQTSRAAQKNVIYVRDLDFVSQRIGAAPAFVLGTGARI